MKRRKASRYLKATCGVLVISVLLFCLFAPWDEANHAEKNENRQTAKFQALQPPAQVKKAHAETPPAPAVVPIPDLFVKSKEWLDAQCPPLSEAEENRLLEENQRSKETFIGLILLNSKRRPALLREAYTLYPDDPSVLRLLLAESDSPYDRKSLDFTKEELMSAAQKLHAAEPHDIEVSMALASHELESGNLSAATEILKATSAEENLGASDKIKNLAIKTSLLEQAGRSKEFAPVRALAGPDGVITSNSFTRQAYNIMLKKNWTPEEETFVRFAIDNSQRELPIASQTAETHAVGLSNESLWASAIQEQHPTDSTFYGKPIADVRVEILNDYREASVYRGMSMAIVPLMQGLKTEERSAFAQTLMESGEIAALKFIQEIRPDYSASTATQVTDWRSKGVPTPTSRFW